MKHPITKIILPITLSTLLLTGCQSPSTSVSSSSLSQPSTVISSATVSPVPDEPASSTPMVENPQDTASEAEPSEDIMQKEIDTSDWMPADPFDIDLAEIEDFLNDSKLLGILSGRNTKVILSESDESRQYLRWAVSLCLTLLPARNFLCKRTKMGCLISLFPILRKLRMNCLESNTTFLLWPTPHPTTPRTECFA